MTPSVETSPRRWRALRLGMAAVLVSLLAACASPLTTQVTTFNRWPADAAGSTFSFMAPAAPAPELEQATYETYVQGALEQQGLKRAAAGQPARLQVEMTSGLSEQARTVLVPIYQDSFVFMPPYRDAFGRLYGGGWAVSPWGPQYMGEQAVNRVMQLASLRIRILDTQQTQAASGATPVVFESSALYEGGRADLPTLVPYLVRSVFDEFPGQNGLVRTVKFDRKTGELLKPAKP